MKNALRILLCMAVTSCATIQPVSFKGFENTRVENMSDGQVKGKVGVKVDNPNVFKIKVKPTTLDVYISDTYVGKAMLTQKAVIRANSIDTHDLNLELDSKSLLKGGLGSVMDLLKGNKMTLRVKGVVKASAKGICKKMAIDETAEFDIPRELIQNAKGLLGG